MDLFTPVVPQEKQHKYFRMLTQTGVYEPLIEVLKSWGNGFIDRDGKFVKEFQTTFDSSFWELYLFACFKELGYTIDLSHEAPDFVLSSSATEFVAEATIASHPQGFRPEWDKDLDILNSTTIDDIVRLSTIRLLQAITKKHKKFISSYSKLHHVQNKPFVICVTPFDQPAFDLQDSRALTRVLYAYDTPLWIPGSQDGEVIMVGESRSYRVQKKPEVNLNLGLFTNPNMADISAIFFSNRLGMCKVRALAKQGNYEVIFFGSRFVESETETGVQRFYQEKISYQETLLDGFQVFLNPFAKYPLNIENFENREVAIHNYNPKLDSYQPKIPNGFLYQRRCFTISSKAEEEVLKEHKSSTSSSNAYQELMQEEWLEDELVYIGGQLGNFSFDKNHMAHYRGWTILVSFCSTDKDWGALAVNTLCYSHQEFIQANGNDKIASTGIQQWFPKKEEAYQTIKQKIDQISEK